LEYSEAVHLLFVDLNKVYASVRREVFSIEFIIPMKLVRIIKSVSE
jgi:hypothetical protein